MSQIYNPYNGIPGIDPPTTTSTTTCNANLVSVTLSAGQSFILPPGATLVGASDKTKLQSDCADLSNVEELECFYCAIPIGAKDGNNSQYWEGDEETFLNGYFYNGIYTNFNPGLDAYDQGGFVGLNNICTQLENIFPGIVGATSKFSVSTDRGTLNFVIIKTFPSIANNLYLSVRTSINTAGPNNTGFGMFPFLKKDDTYSSDIWENLPFNC